MSIDLTDASDARISVDDVTQGAFATELSEEEISEHIATANSIVNDRLVNSGLKSSRLARIELYLTRHLIRFLVEPEVQSENLGAVNRSYTGNFSHEDLRSTRPGQQALMLDTSNTLGTQEFDQFFTMG